MREKQSESRRFSKKAIILTVLSALAVSACVFFGVIAFFNEDVAYEYAEVSPTLQVDAQQNGQVGFSANLPARTGINQTSAIVALDHKTDTAYVQYTVFVSARRKEIEFGTSSQKVFFTRDADGTAHEVVYTTDENGNTAEYRKVVCEIRYAIFRAGGLSGIEFLEEPVTLWSIPLPESAVSAA